MSDRFRLGVLICLCFVWSGCSLSLGTGVGPDEPQIHGSAEICIVGKCLSGGSDVELHEHDIEE